MTDNYLLPLLISASTLITMLLFFITLFVLVNKNKHRRLYADKKELEHKFEREILTTRLEAQEESLARVSQEIHDNVCQVLGHIKNNLYAITYNLNVDNNENLLAESTDLVGQSIQDLRNISHVLNPEHVKRISLEEAIEKELKYLKSFYEVDFKLDLDGDPIDIPKEKEIVIFRIAQEALSNITKHANATEVIVSIGYTDKDVVLSISDNGDGFDAEAIKNSSKGIGLINMEERAKLINGTFDIRSMPQKGTRITIKVNTQG